MKTRKPFVVMLSLLVAMSSVVIAPFNAFAAKGSSIYSTKSIQDKTRLALNANILASCIWINGDRDSYGTKLSQDDVNNANFIVKSQKVANGYISGDDDDVLNCRSLSSNTIAGILRNTGFGSGNDGIRTTLCNMGAPATPNRNECASGQSGELTVNYKAIANALRNKQPIDDYKKYYAGYQTLKKHCGYTDLGVVNTDIKPGDTTSNDVRIVVVTGKDGSYEEHYYRLNDPGKRVHPYNYSNGNSVTVSCKVMVEEHMSSANSDWTKAYVNYLKQNQPGTGDSPGTCEEKYGGLGQSAQAQRNACKEGYANKDDVNFCSVTYNHGGIPAEQYAACRYGAETATGADGETPQAEEEDNNTEEGEKTCNIDGLGWIVCPVVNFMATMSDNIANQLQKFLLFESSNLTSDQEGSVQYYWRTMRDYANILLVIAFLVIIYSQLTGYGMSNYGIKSMLPKLVICVLLINVSFYICAAMVDVSNLIGASAFNFISTGTVDVSSSGGFWSEGVNNGFANVTATLLLAGTVAWFALGTLIAGLISVILIGLTTVILLGARTAIIILLIVISPLAFAAMLLPNTEGLFKKWWQVFKTMLFLYPIIGVIYGASSLAANILNNQATSISDETTQTVMQIIAAVLAFLPMLVVPSAVKKAMAIGNISNLVGRLQGGANKYLGGKAKDRINSGTYGKMRNYQQQQRQIRQAKARAGIRADRFRGGRANPLNWAGRSSAFLHRNVSDPLLRGTGQGDVVDDIKLRASEIESKEFRDQVDLVSKSFDDMSFDDINNMALGNKGTYTEAQTQAATEYIMAKGNFAQRSALYNKTGEKDDNGNLKMSQRQRAAISDGMAKAGDQKVYGAKAIDMAKMGRISPNGGLENLVAQNIASGKLKNEAMVHDADATKLIADVASSNKSFSLPSANGEGSEIRTLSDSERNKVRQTAQRAYDDSNLTRGMNDVMREQFKRLGVDVSGNSSPANSDSEQTVRLHGDTFDQSGSGLYIPRDRR